MSCARTWRRCCDPQCGGFCSPTLLNQARAEGRPFDELLQYFALERLLYRIGRSEYAERFVLKGALMFGVWQGEYIRPTRDVDLLGYLDNSVDNLVDVFQTISALTVLEDDGLQLHAGDIRGERIAATSEYEGVRLHIPAALGTARLRLRVDVGFGDVLIAGPNSVQLPTVLDFPPPEVRGYSRETAIAEKLQAMVYLGAANSRMKDFYDIWFLAGNFSFEGRLLARAVRETFRQRRTQLPLEPYAFTEAFARDNDKRAQWSAFTRRLPSGRAPDTLDEVIQFIASFLQPVIQTVHDDRPFKLSWPLGGFWH